MAGRPKEGSVSKKLFTVLCVTFTVLFATLPVSAQLREDRDPRMRIDRNAAVQIALERFSFMRQNFHLGHVRRKE